MTWLNLLRWEWFKLRSRRVIWFLLAVLVIFSAAIVVLRFGDYEVRQDRAIRDEVLFLPGVPLPEDEVQIDCEDYLATGRLPDAEEFPAPLTPADVDTLLTERECNKEVVEIRAAIDKLVDEFTLPGAIPKALRWTQLISIPFLAFITVLVVSSEYDWGTLRTVLMRGTGRRQILSVKLVLIALAMAVTWLMVLATIVATSVVVTALSDVSHGSWTAAVTGEVIVDTAKAWFSGVPYIALAALLSVLFSTWSGGTLAAAGVATGYFFIDVFSFGRLIKLFEDVSGMGWLSSIAEYDLGWNTAAWMFGQAGEPIPGFALAGAIGQVQYPSDLHSFLVLVTYTAAILWLAFRLFRRRDVAGPTG